MTEKKIKYILIDFGGTFFTHGTSIAIGEFSDILGISITKATSVLRSDASPLAVAYRLGKINGKTFWDETKRKLRIDSKTAKRLEDVWHSCFRPNKGMKNLVKRLGEKYQVFVISGNTPDRIKYLKKKYSLDKLFHGFFFSFDCGVTKPNPQFLKIVLKKLKAEPQQCLLIDDSKEFNGVAKRLGIKGIVFKNAAQLTRDLRRQGIL